MRRQIDRQIDTRGRRRQIADIIAHATRFHADTAAWGGRDYHLQSTVVSVDGACCVLRGRRPLCHSSRRPSFRSIGRPRPRPARSLVGVCSLSPLPSECRSREQEDEEEDEETAAAWACIGQREPRPRPMNATLREITNNISSSPGRRKIRIHPTIRSIG